MCRCPFRLEVTAPAGNIVVSNGQLVRQVLSDDDRHITFEYVVETPISAPHIAVAVGPFSAFPDPDIPEITHFCLPGSEQKLQHACLRPPVQEQPKTNDGGDEGEEAEGEGAAAAGDEVKSYTPTIILENMIFLV